MRRRRPERFGKIGRICRAIGSRAYAHARVSGGDGKRSGYVGVFGQTKDRKVDLTCRDCRIIRGIFGKENYARLPERQRFEQLENRNGLKNTLQTGRGQT
jgi:hypothetical protein